MNYLAWTKIFILLDYIIHSAGRLSGKESESSYISYKNPHPQWCPNVSCRDSHFCRTCDRRFLFIITHGRAGSTTIRNMINALPGIRLSGEIGESFKMMKDLVDHVNYQNSNRNDQDKLFESAHGHNEYVAGSLSCPVQHLVEVLDPPVLNEQRDDSLTILGFKEIRLNSATEIEFLLKYFPCSRIIFNVRKEIGNIIKSQEKTRFGNPVKPLELHERAHLYEEYYWFYKSLNPQRIYWMEFEEWTNSGDQHFTDLAKWLGYKDCVYPFMLHDHKIGSYKLDKRQIDLGPTCRYIGTNTLR